MPSDKLNNYIREIVEQGKENAKHIEVINGELGGIKEHLAVVKTDVAWLKKFQWIIIGTSVAALITGLIKLL